MSNKIFSEIIYSIKNKNRKIFSDYFYLILISFFLILFFITLLLFTKVYSSRELKVIFLDVGQGDSILIQTPDGQKILIDAGPDDKVIRKIESYLSIFNKEIDLVIMSHGDSDHITGFLYLFPKYNVKNILVNGDQNKESSIYLINQEKIEQEIEFDESKTYIANCGDILSFGKDENLIEMYILNPVKGGLIINDSNENSVVSLLVYKDYSFLFLGDASQEIENKLFLNIENCFEKSVSLSLKEKLQDLTVLKVSHHGSNTGSSASFLKLIKPEYAVISAGKDNRFNHPHKEVVEILEKYSKNILNTVNTGDIIFQTDGKNLEIIKAK